MKRRKLLSLFLAISMVASVAVTPVYAAPKEENAAAAEKVAADEKEDVAGETVTGGKKKVVAEKATKKEAKKTKNKIGKYKFDMSQFDLSIHVNEMKPDKKVKVDKKDPMIAAVSEELDGIEVLAEDGKKVGLTDEQKGTVLDMYQKYLTYWTEHADILGVQLPFYLSYNDNKEDGLGILGEMLVLANVSVEDVRNGNYSYDDLTGMIMNFMYGDMLGIEYYGGTLKQKRDEALNIVQKSGAKTLVQKMLVLNDWLARQDSFDMSYIMNSGKEEPVMVAENPKDHPHKRDVYNVIYPVYEKQIHDQFYNQFYEGIKADLVQKFYEKAIWQGVYQSTYDQIVGQAGAEPETPTDPEVPETQVEGEVDPNADAAAKAQADKFMEDNKGAIAADAPGFVKKAFGEEAAAQMAVQADGFIQMAETEGVEVDPVNAPGVKMTIAQLTDQTMDTQTGLPNVPPELSDKTANELIPIFAKQAADGLTNGILNYWEGNHFGALAEGKSVCLGYAKAFAWLMQCMSPEIYGKNGAGTDMTVASNWRTAKELYYDENGNLDTSKNYNVDLVRITFNAKVTMYGEVQPDFNSDHFWNAVQVDGKWYYVDPCYTDTYSEVMVRDRVEMDGYINHMYFMFSHSAAAELYDGYYSQIKTLYADKATYRDYEKSWMSRIKSDTLTDGKNFYYVYDSMDMIQMNNEYNNNNNYEDMDTDSELKLVRHAITNTDAGDKGDTDYTALIEFNHKVNEKDEDDDTTVARVLNKEGKYEDNKLLTDLFAKYKEQRTIYPSINITAALYNNKLYFNLSNYILSYDLSTCEVKVVKEYTTVYGTRDKSVAFGGMAFSMNETSGGFKVENHPIAAMSLKEDGKLHVSIATNFAYISGKDAHNSDDKGSFGYEYEESNFNARYNNYMNDENGMAEQMGYTKEINDNDEFMWVANFVGTENMSTLEKAEVEIDEDFVVPMCDHHFVKFEEEYYTKTNGKWNTGHCYVCPECGYAVDNPIKPKNNAPQEVQDQYKEDKERYDEAAAKAGHKYIPTDAKWSEDSTQVTFKEIKCSSVCPDRATTMDCLLGDEKIGIKFKEAMTLDAKVVRTEGTCTEGAKVYYEATTETKEGYKITATNKVELAPGMHTYTGDFDWKEATDESATVPYTATVSNVKCSICGDERENVDAPTVAKSDKSYAPTCEEDGADIYVATSVIKDADGKEIGRCIGEKKVPIKALGHKYGDPIVEWTAEKDESGKVVKYTKATATLPCTNDGCTHTIVVVDEELERILKNNASCTEGGICYYEATFEFGVEGVETYTAKSEDVEVGANGHDYAEPVFTWLSGNAECKATFKCVQGDDTKVVDCKVTSKTTKATLTEDGKITYTATCDFNGKTYEGTTKTIIPYPQTLKLSATHFNYDKTEKKPNVIVTGSDGKAIPTSNYEVSFNDSEGRIVYATYHVYVTFKGDQYEGEKTLTYEIGPTNPKTYNVMLYGYDDAEITWTPVKGVTGYKVYYKKYGGSKYYQIGTTTATSFRRENLADGERYTFKIMPYKTMKDKTTGKINDLEGAGIAKSIYAMKKVATPKVTRSGNYVKVSWTNIEGEGGYQISKSTSSTGTSIVSTWQTSTGSSKNISATKGKTYYYKVRAYKIQNGKKIYAPWSTAVKFKR